MSEQMKVVQTLDDRDVVAAFARQLQLLTKLERGYEKIGKGGENAGQQTQMSFAGAGREILKMGATLTGIGSIVGAATALISTIRKEIQHLRQEQGRAGSTQVEIAAKERAAAFNFGPERAAEMRRQIDSISTETGADRGALYDAISAAFSFKGANLNDQQAIESVRQAARLAPTNQEGMQFVSQGILAQMKKAGGTAKDVLGQQIAIKRLSPVVQDQDFSTYIAPAIANLTDFGNTPQEAGAFLAALGQGMGDRSGRQTSTAAIELSRQLAVKVPQRKGIMQQLDFLNSEEGAGVRHQLLGVLEQQSKEATAAAEATGDVGLTAQARAFASVMQLVQPGDNEMKKLLRDTLAATPKTAGAGRQFDTDIAAINSGALQKSLLLQQGFKVGAEGLRLDNTIGGQAGISREGLQDLLSAAGVSQTGIDLDTLQFEVGTRGGSVAPIPAAVSTLRRRAKSLGETKYHSFPSSEMDFGGGSVAVAPSARDLDTAKALSGVADRLETVIGKQVSATDRNTNETRRSNNKRSGPPVAANSRGRR